MTTNQTDKDTPYEKTEAILRAAGYQCIREVETLRHNKLAPDRRIEFWAGERGVIVLQVWKQSDGCAAYANWPLGTSFDDLKEALLPRWREIASAPKDGTVILARWVGGPIIKLWWFDGKPDPDEILPIGEEPQMRNAGWYDGHGYYEGLREWHPLPK